MRAFRVFDSVSVLSVQEFSGPKSPKVSGRVREYSRFAETVESHAESDAGPEIVHGALRAYKIYASIPLVDSRFSMIFKWRTTW